MCVVLCCVEFVLLCFVLLRLLSCCVVCWFGLVCVLMLFVFGVLVCCVMLCCSALSV